MTRHADPGPPGSACRGADPPTRRLARGPTSGCRATPAAEGYALRW
ncbi:hypothetical protein ACFSEO_09375 [Agromyces cerinus subsp. nitratus]